MKTTLIRIPTCLLLVLAPMILAFGTAQVAFADAIPYPSVGTPNPTTYTFTATTTGHVIAYFAGSDAGYDLELGLLVNGISTGVMGLDDHSSIVGQSLDLGHVNAGDTFVFVLQNNTLGMNAYSDPSVNVAYDISGSVGHNHVYSTPYTATSPKFDSIPVGTFVAFEDLGFPNSDFDYNDESFVFTNVSKSPTTVPEPATFFLLGTGLLGLMGKAIKRNSSVNSLASPVAPVN